MKDKNIKFDDLIKNMEEAYFNNIDDSVNEFKNIGINIMTEDRKLKPFLEVVDDLILIWDTALKGEDYNITKHYIIQKMVGIRYKNYLLALIELISRERFKFSELIKEIRENEENDN